MRTDGDVLFVDREGGGQSEAKDGEEEDASGVDCHGRRMNLQWIKTNVSSLRLLLTRVKKYDAHILHFVLLSIQKADATVLGSTVVDLSRHIEIEAKKKESWRHVTPAAFLDAFHLCCDVGHGKLATGKATTSGKRISFSCCVVRFCGRNFSRRKPSCRRVCWGSACWCVFLAPPHAQHMCECVH